MLDLSAIDGVVKNDVFPVMFEQYDQQPLVFPLLGSAIPEAQLQTPFGHKTYTLAGMGRPKVRKDGADIQHVLIGEGYPVLLAVRLLSERMDIPQRTMERLDAKGLGATLRDGTSQWGKAFAQKKEAMAARLFNKGALTAGDLEAFDNTFDDGSEVDPYPKFIYDGLPFFDTAHPAKVTGTTYSNHEASAALSATTFDTAYVAMTSTNAKDERSERILINPDVLVVPPALRGTAMRVLESELLPGVATNDKNPNRGLVRPVMWSYLDDADGWFLGQSGDGIIYHDSGAPTMEISWDAIRKTWVVSAECRFGIAVKNWRKWHGNNIAAA